MQNNVSDKCQQACLVRADGGEDERRLGGVVLQHVAVVLERRRGVGLALFTTLFLCVKTHPLADSQHGPVHVNNLTPGSASPTEGEGTTARQSARVRAAESDESVVRRPGAGGVLLVLVLVLVRRALLATTFSSGEAFVALLVLHRRRAAAAVRRVRVRGAAAGEGAVRAKHDDDDDMGVLCVCVCVLRDTPCEKWRTREGWWGA
jgi:hypothetical protein